MEKLLVEHKLLRWKSYHPPPTLEAYDSQNCTYDLSDSLVENAGSGLIDGTAIGFVYNFIKGNNSCRFKSRLCSAFAKSPCIGGNFALMALGCILSRAAYFKCTGETPRTYSMPYQYEIPCAAIGGAVGFARHGLRPALLGALMSTGMMSYITMVNVRKTRYLSSISKTNTYTYPYYRRRPTQGDNRDNIPWPEALWSQDNSETSIHRDYDDISWLEASWIHDDSSLPEH